MGHTKDFGGGITVRANGDKPGQDASISST